MVTLLWSRVDLHVSVTLLTNGHNIFIQICLGAGCTKISSLVLVCWFNY